MLMDKDTGLPALPDGQAWRVHFPEEGYHAWLHIVYANKGESDFPFLDSIDTEMISGSEFRFLFFGGLLTKDKVRPRHIRHAAKELLKRRAKARQVHARTAQVAAKYEGSYPPKRL